MNDANANDHPSLEQLFQWCINSESTLRKWVEIGAPEIAIKHIEGQFIRRRDALLARLRSLVIATYRNKLETEIDRQTDSPCLRCVHYIWPQELEGGPDEEEENSDSEPVCSKGMLSKSRPVIKDCPHFISDRSAEDEARIARQDVWEISWLKSQLHNFQFEPLLIAILGLARSGATGLGQSAADLPSSE